MNLSDYFALVLESHLPAATAFLAGNADYPELGGIVKFYETSYGGLLVSAEVSGLPVAQNEKDTGFFGMHIHEVGDCTPPFAETGTHYNPFGRPHPMHVGDLPPLLADRGYAWNAFFDDRLTINEIVGRSVIIHRLRDDFTTQPAGDSGEKIGCGVIQAVAR
ncbi:MAG TPA: superoxide dismutase family protein [Lachnospiraceae bacterium]|nr:superoxide dismutase family protein [Lachnospiraceae bacterium]